MYKIINLIIGLIVTFAIPLGLLWLATTYSNKQNKKDGNI
jgi:hypothetical protein